jgi:hypothetical protein
LITFLNREIPGPPALAGQARAAEPPNYRIIERIKVPDGGFDYATYDAATGKFTADPATADCGHSCHVAVKSKDYIFHPYQQR